MGCTFAFQQVLDHSSHKPMKIQVDKGSEFYNKSWLQDNGIQIYSTKNEERFFAAERFIRNQKSKIYRNMTAISKKLYIDKLDNIINKCNNTYHTTIKMKPTGVKLNTYIDYHVENNEKNLNLKLLIM